MKKNIMIKSAIAGAIIAATTATTVADVSLYGRLRGGLNCVDAGGSSDVDCGIVNNSSRFGIKASHEISDGLTAIGRYEFQVDIADNQGVTGRQAWAGLRGGFGEATLGERVTPLYNYVEGPVDQPNAYGSYRGAQGLIDFRRAKTVNYKNKFGPAALHVQVGMADGDPGSDFADSIELAAGFKAGPVNLGVGYLGVTDVKDQVGLYVGAPIGNHAVGLAVVNESPDGAGSDILGITAYGKIGLGGGKDIHIQYSSDDVDGSSNTPYGIGVEYDHRLSKNFQWYAGVNVDDVDIAGVDNTTSYGTGIRYDF